MPTFPGLSTPARSSTKSKKKKRKSTTTTITIELPTVAVREARKLRVFSKGALASACTSELLRSIKNAKHHALARETRQKRIQVVQSKILKLLESHSCITHTIVCSYYKSRGHRIRGHLRGQTYRIAEFVKPAIAGLLKTRKIAKRGKRLVRGSYENAYVLPNVVEKLATL